MNLLKGVFSSFMNVIEPIASFIVDVVVGAFEALGNAADKMMSDVSMALEFLGFDGAAKKVRDFTSATSDLIDKTNELSDLESKLLKTRREQRLIEKQALIDAEKLRQQRDDESNSLSQRIEFNRQLSEVLRKQSKEELAIAGDALKAAQLKLEIDGRTTEALDGLAEAQLEILDINERINGQQSEQLANENSLRNEGIANAKERADLRKAAADLETKEDEERHAAKIEKRNKRREEQDEFEALQLERKTEREAGEKATQDRITEEQRLRLEEEVAAFKVVENTKATIRNNSIDNIQAGMEFVAGLDEDNKALQAGVLIATNAAAIAKTVITTQAGNAAATAEGVALAIPTAGASVAAAASLVASNNISAAISIGSSIAATAKGLAALKKGGSAGSKPSFGGGGSTSASAPELNKETLFSSQNLQGAETEKVGESAGINQIKAIVVESDITNIQNKISDLESASEIG